jgi:hypothetical protein
MAAKQEQQTIEIQQSGSLIDFLLPASRWQVLALTQVRQGLYVRTLDIRQGL